MDTILYFDSIYQTQKLKELLPMARELNLSSLEGVRGYCDETSASYLRRQLKALSANGIHFLGSGNYHYVSLFFLEQITQPFSLILFDYHTDMQIPMLGNLLSCGSWVFHALESLPNLQELIMIGVGEDSLYGTKETTLKTAAFSTVRETEELCILQYHNHKNTVPITIRKAKTEYEDWETFYQNHLHYPFFLSVDKDVLSKKELETDWDQGTMPLQEFSNACEKLFCRSLPLGIDICGEGNSPKSILQGVKINRAIIRLYQDAHRKNSLR